MGGVVSSNTQDCGEGNRPYWLVLPGQTRFDAFEIRVPGGTTLFDVDLVLQEIGVPRMGAPPIRRWLKWSGTVDDAIAAGQKVGIPGAKEVGRLGLRILVTKSSRGNRPRACGAVGFAVPLRSPPSAFPA